MAREFEKEMTRSVKKIENEMQKAGEEKGGGEIGKHYQRTLRRYAKDNTRIERTIDGKERKKAIFCIVRRRVEEFGRGDSEDEGTHEFAMNAAQREFTEALEKERRLS